MRWLLAVLLSLLLASDAGAAIARLAVFSQTSGAPGGANYSAALGLLRQTGTPCDIYNAALRTWGSPGVADSTWFRQRYSAVLVLYEAGQDGGLPVTSGEYGTNFLDAGAVARVGNSPLSGRWAIPCFVMSPDRLVPSASFNDTSANAYVAGITSASPAGTFATPAVANAGTWRSRFLCRLRGNMLDTLWTATNIMGCRPASWGGAGTVAALVYADTTFGGGGVCAAGDTITLVWRYRPRDDRPGVYFSILPQVYTAGTVSNIGMLTMLQYIYTLTDIKPMQKIALPITIHDGELGSLTSVAAATQARIFDTLRVNRIPTILATPLHGTQEYPSMYNAANLNNLRGLINDNLMVWHPFSYNNVGENWALNYYLATDTTGVRQRWNSLYNTGSRADSFNFKVTAYSPRRIVSASGIVGAWQTKVLADAGVEVVESTFQSQSGAAGWVAQYGSFLVGSTNLMSVPGTRPAENRVIAVQAPIAFPHDTSFTTLKAGAADHEYIGSVWMRAMQYAVNGGVGLYWHNGGSVGASRQDPYWAYLMSIMGKNFRYFDRVIEPTNRIAQTRFPRGFSSYSQRN